MDCQSFVSRIARVEEMSSDEEEDKIERRKKRKSKFDEMKENILKRNSEGVFPYWPHSIEETLKKRYKAKAHKTGYVIPGLVPKPESKLTKKEEIELIDRLYMLGAEWGVEFSDIAEQTAARRGAA